MSDTILEVKDLKKYFKTPREHGSMTHTTYHVWPMRKQAM